MSESKVPRDDPYIRPLGHIAAAFQLTARGCVSARHGRSNLHDANWGNRTFSASCRSPIDPRWAGESDCARAHRLGLKPIHRRVSAPIGERPIALDHHRYEWLYVTSRERRDGLVSFQRDRQAFFVKLLAAFAREPGAGCDRNHRPAT
jgi:hypothetical protein